ncbi:hypothetical protein [Amycolatopsis sp. Hca4]|uniref:hypothetical protein n=1 Tax=Amycolatopsis sp. Hca4 TaxID=2742131 RepID=UPI0015904B9F|nr:hypothetical protein [Amycolatopsis sp. Hca4]QKV73909.1 hypothetical protein HUT10_09105 [Amycolatopsis sp. Hca4]
MNHTHIGLLTGLVLGLAAAFGGVGAFLLVLLLGGLGLLVVRFLDGKLDISAMSGRDRG